MLVLARRLEEEIHIGDNIVVKIVAFRPGIVKLGIEAPKDVTIMRKELLPHNKFDTKAQHPKLGHNKHDDAK